MARGKLFKLSLAEIHPYANNPRRNDNAVEAVAESIRQCGYIAPIIIDEDGEILAGHTRYKALLRLGYQEADVLMISEITDEQKRKYRLLDNKTGEIAAWDNDMLMDEIQGLDFGKLDIDWSIEDFGNQEQGGFKREEIDLAESVSIVIDCKDDVEAEEIFYKLSREGYKCRISTL